MDPLAGTATGVTAVIWLLLFAMAVLWFTLPFIVLGIKNRMDLALKHAALANERLEKIEARIAVIAQDLNQNRKSLDLKEPKE